MSCEKPITTMVTKKTKKCPKCDEFLPVSEFYKNKSHSDGLDNVCKKHKLEQGRKYRSFETESWLKMFIG
jgi:hypothetical protein